MYDEDEEEDYFYNMIYGKKDSTMSEDRTKKHWKVEGNNNKFGTLKEAEDEAKRRSGKQNCDYNIYEFVAQAQAVVPDVPIVKIV
jgi:hypothetical protein